MDIWDALRLVIRHWRKTVVVFVVGLAVSLGAYAAAPTEWKIQGTIVLLGPTQNARIIDQTVVVEDVNPFFEAGVAMPLTRVLAFAFRDPSKVGQIAREGLSTHYTMEWDNRQPLLTVKVSADDAETARATLERLLEMLAVDLEQRQAEVGAPELERAGMEVLAVSDPKEDFKTPRLLAGAGLAVTLAAVVGSAFAAEWWEGRKKDDLAVDPDATGYERTPPGDLDAEVGGVEETDVADGGDGDDAPLDDRQSEDGAGRSWSRRRPA